MLTGPAVTLTCGISEGQGPEQGPSPPSGILGGQQVQGWLLLEGPSLLATLSPTPSSWCPGPCPGQCSEEQPQSCGSAWHGSSPRSSLGSPETQRPWLL